MKNLVKDASMGPVREALKQGMEITKLNKEDMRPVSLQDFEKSLQVVRSSVSLDELGAYEDWNDKFGSLSTIETCDSVDRHRKKNEGRCILHNIYLMHKCASTSTSCF